VDWVKVAQGEGIISYEVTEGVTKARTEE